MTEKKILILSLLLSWLLPVQPASAQPQEAMLLNIQQRFEDYCMAVPREEIYVHTDRKEYIAGEEIWFKIILTDRQSSAVSSRSSIAYFELLNSDNKPVLQKRFRLNSGIGPGQVLLPDSLNSGMYTMRVYTSWMKNFLPSNCFMKEISIYNAFNIKTFRRKIYDQDAPGLPGSVHDTSGITDHLKITSVRPGTGGIEIDVYADDAYRSQNGDIMYLFIQTHGRIDRSASEKITGENTRISVPYSSLTPGINQITIFDSKGKVICEKLTYTPDVDSDQNLVINCPDSFSTRSKIKLGIQLPVSGKKTDFSVSVAPLLNNSEETDFRDYMVFGSEYGLLPFEKICDRKLTEISAGELDSLLTKLRSNWLSWEKIMSDEIPVFRYETEKEEHFIDGLLLAEGQQLGFPGENIVLSVPGKVARFRYAVTNQEAEFRFPVPIDNNIVDLIMQPFDTGRNYRIFIESSFSEKYYPSRKLIDSVTGPLIPVVSKWSLNYQLGRIFGSSFTSDQLLPPEEPRKLKRFYGKPDMELVMKDFIKLPTMEEVFYELIPRVRIVKTGKNYEISFLDFSGNKLYEEPPVLMIDGVIFNDASVIARLDPEAVERIDVIRGIYHVGNFAFYGIVNVITNAGNFIRLTLPDYASRFKYWITEPALNFVSPDYSDPEVKNSRDPDLRNTLYWNPLVKPVSDGSADVEFWSSDFASDYLIDIRGISSDGKIFSARKIIKVR